MLSHKLREHFEFWILPQINPDGIVSGNYRCNTQGKDMNRCFYADDDPEAKLRLHEVELIRSFMEENFSKKIPEKRSKLKMFLDVHAHSGQRDIFIYAPHAAQEEAMTKIQNFPKLLDSISPYFNFQGCKFGNEKYKKNCARLGVFRDYDLNHSYTIESSCWGYTEPETDATVQFKELDFIKFGKHLAEGIARQFSIDVSDADRTSMFSGLDIQLDFAMYEDEKETKKKVKLMKKTGGKALGGKLFKMTQMMPKQDPVKPRVDHKMKEEFLMGDDSGPSFLPNANMKDSDMQNPHEIHKTPRVRRIVGAQIIGKDGKQMSMEMPLNGSNPEELNAQLTAFLEQQKLAEDARKGKNSDTSMPAINGRNVANNNTSNQKTKKDNFDPFQSKYKKI